MLDRHCLERVWSWHLVSDLHPLRAEDVNFLDVSEPLLFHWMLSVLALGTNGDPALVLGDDLHHREGLTVSLLVLHVTVLGIVHKTEVGWHVLLVTEHLSATFLGGELVHL